ncbi:MAG: PepSY domain-containing protein [Williamsia sp.]|nr:PepSY domain-containing protein [Williamsia sp.]
MTISVWRYSHLALAVSSFLFIALASLTGIILAFQPVAEKSPSYRAADFNQLTLAESIPHLGKSFSGVTDVSIDVNQFIAVKGTDSSGKNRSAYIDPRTGKMLGIPGKENPFFQWVTALHRSLFLHEAGRFFVGLTAFLLLLIALSGTILVIQRQRSLKRFFSRIVKENFAQYYHVVLGRLSLIPIILLALTGTYLSLARFGVFPEKKITHKIDFDAIKSGPAIKPADFPAFKGIPLSQVQSIEYPFSDDPEDYYTLKLKDREMVVNQFTGETLSEIRYPFTTILSELSLDLHTGRTNRLWAIILAIASANILFFIYSGFVITRRRLSGRLKNRYKPAESRIIILAGSENGSTMRFAKAVHQQLIANGQRAYLTELNRYNTFARAEHLVVITATYGMGDPPTNANRFQALLEKYPQPQPVQFSVVGFGSHAYPDFCQFAFEVNNLLSAQSWATPLLEIYTVNDKSIEQFSQWFSTWSQKINLPGMALPAAFHQKPADLQAMAVIEKTELAYPHGPFIIRLKPASRASFNSGDLLAIYPAGDHRERLYSIGKIGKSIQLSVKLHPSGLGSGFLYGLAPGSTLHTRIVPNAHFRFPQKAPAVIMISNGTGIAPFLGMIDQNTQKTDCSLYCGFRDQASFGLYRDAMEKSIELQKLRHLRVAYSREGKKQYVKDLLAHDKDFIAATLAAGGVLMLCGSLAMQKQVVELLEEICQEKGDKNISFYQSHGQLLMDCY